MKVLACHIYTKPDPVILGQNYEVHVTGGIPNQSYEKFSCESNFVFIAGIACTLRKAFEGNFTTDAKGELPIFYLPAREFPILGSKQYYFEFTAKDQKGNTVDHCYKTISYALAGSTAQPDFLKRECAGKTGVDTAIGCVPVDNFTNFLKFTLKWAFFASGGIILLMLIATGYSVITSQGDPEKLQAAKENVTSIFSGLILIAFSLILLQTIGADVLNLPTFK